VRWELMSVMFALLRFRQGWAKCLENPRSRPVVNVHSQEQAAACLEQLVETHRGRSAVVHAGGIAALSAALEGGAHACRGAAYRVRRALGERGSAAPGDAHRLKELQRIRV
jgi:hypothetical protein